MESTENARPNLEQIQAGFVSRRIRSAADRLRALANTLDRSANSVEHVGEKGYPTRYANIASEVQHEVLWGLANLHLDSLPTDAADADLARAERLARGEQ